MRRFKRGFKIKILVSVIAVIAAIGIISATSFASNDEPANRAFLGDGYEYGIVCKTLSQECDMQTNFATAEYVSGGHHTEADLANTEGVYRVGEIKDSLNLKHGSSSKALVLEGKEYAEEVETILASIASHSKAVVGTSDLTASKEVADQNKYVIDITGVDKDIVYVDADPLMENMKLDKIAKGGLHIKMKASQSIVLNVKEAGEFTIERYTVDVSGSKTKEEIAESVIWNMPNAGGLTLASDGIHATVIAPNATVKVLTTGEGWLVGYQVMVSSGEWHMISQDLPVPTFTPTPTPEVTDTPKPTKTPKVTDTPAPTETPKVTDTPAPTETPKVTDTPMPEDTATPIPEATATPTPEVTATPTPEPTPEITATPAPTPEPTATPTPVPTATPTPEGELVITKTIAGIDSDQVEGNISFEITNTETQKSQVLKLKDFDKKNGKYSYTLKKVVAGTYTVKEVAQDENDYTLASVSYSLDGASAIAGKTVETTVNDDEQTTVAYENTYEQDQGFLVLTKTLQGPIEEKDAVKTVSFEITNIATKQSETIDLDEFTFEDGKYVYLYRGVVGSYEVIESAKDAEGVILASVTYTVNSKAEVEGEKAEADVAKDDYTVLSYKNQYSPVETPTPVPEATPTATPEVTPTATPEVTPTATPEVTPTATPEVTPTATPEVTPVVTPEVTPTATPEVTPTATPEATPTATPEVTPTATPEATPVVTPEVTPTATPEVTPTATPEVTPTAIPEVTPTATPEATPTATPEVTPTATPEVTPTATDTPEATETPLLTVDDETPLANLTENDTPKSNTVLKDKDRKSKTVTTLLDDDVPLSDSAPETGDDTNLLFPLLAMGASVLAIILLLVYRRTHNE